MMFREIRRVESIEKIIKEERRKREEEGFRKIKPETDMTVEEARDIWMQIWNQACIEEAAKNS